MSQKVIIDADPGIGDAAAIALAMFDPGVDVVAITATAGSVGGVEATRNAQAIVDFLDPPRWPRLGSSQSVSPKFDRHRADGAISQVDLNGPTGLGDCKLNVAELHHQHESAKLMIDIARSTPNEVTLLTLGPLTNVEIAMERAPEFLGLLKGLVCLGGAVRCGGDVTAAAEFNVFTNPEAARNVLRSPATKTLIPLDVSNRVVLTFEQFDRLSTAKASPLVEFLGQLLPFSFRAHHQHLGLEGIGLHAIVALAAISRPKLFESQPMVIDVETKGELTRGMTVFDRRGVHTWKTNIDVACEIDVQGVLDYFSLIVRKAAM